MAAAILQANATAAAQANATAAAQAQAVPDKPDMALILTGLLLLVVLYALMGVCSHMDTPEDGDPMAARFAQMVARKWAVPWRSFRTDQMPALCNAMIEPTSDVPLLVPTLFLEQGLSSWTMPILKASREKLFFASLDTRTDGRPHVLRIQGRSAHGASDHVLATISSALEICNSEGHHFARLVKGRTGEYYMEAVGGASCVLTPNADQDMRHVALTVTSRVKGRLLATAVRGEGAEAKYLKVTSSHGVDMVLVLAAVLGLCTFELARPPPPQAPEDAVEGELAGHSLAGDLLAGLQLQS